MMFRHRDSVLLECVILPWVMQPHNPGLFIFGEAQLLHDDASSFRTWPNHCARAHAAPKFCERLTNELKRRLY
jgi:hypothetical protein